MSDGQCVETLEELEAKNDDFRGQYGALMSTSPEDEQGQALVGKLRVFLAVCALHGKYMPTGTLERRSLRNIVDYWRSRLERDGYAVDGIAELEGYDPDAGVPLYDNCPYPGLEPYDESRKDDFFGREKLAEDYADKLEAQGVFLIIGGSGSGKSSVALAGMGPVCKARHPGWCFPNPIKPGSDPLGALAASIVEKTGGDAEELASQLKKNPAEAASLLGAKLNYKPTLLIIDQFEEVLTLCSEADAQKAFAEVLLALAPPNMAVAEQRFYLLFTLRDDHQGRFGNNPDLKPLHDRLMGPDCNVNLPAMQQGEILQAILKPARRVRLRFVPAEVAEKLAGQAASLMNGLPLLQFALYRLWWEGRDPKQDGEGRPRDFISEAQLKGLPDVSSALGEHAEHVYQTLDSPQQKKICERLILELLFLAENFTEPVRRRRPVGELCEVIGRALGAGADEVRGVIQIFVDERLLRRFTEKGEDQLEVAHEALLRHWKTISELVFGDEMKARLFRIKEVQKEAVEWRRNQGSKGWLKQRGEPLKKVEKDVGEFFLFDQDSRDYVKACRDEEDRIGRGEQEKRKAEKRATHLGWGVVGAVVILGGGIYFAQQRNDSNLSAVASLSDRLPPWEGLDLTRTLAENNEMFSGALGHALERMNDARIVGAPGSVLTLLGDGDALLNLPTREGADNKLCLYGLEKPVPGKDDWGVVLSSPRGVCVEPSGQFERGALSAEFATEGSLKGKRLFVAIFRAKKNGMLDTKAWLVKLRGETAGSESVPVSGLSGSWSIASQVVMRPDGLEASFGVVESEGNNVHGRLVTLALKEEQERKTFRLDAGPVVRGPVVNALGYVSAPKDEFLLVRATPDGLSCGDRVSNARGTKEAGAAAVAISTAVSSDVFAVLRRDGQIELFRCAGGDLAALKHEALKGDFSSVRLQTIERDKLSLSVQIAGSGRQCFDYEAPGTLTERLMQKPCNSNHPVLAAAYLGKNAQVAIELSSEAPVIRRYPAEFDLEAFRLVRAAWQNSTVLCQDGRVEKTDKPSASGAFCAVRGREDSVLAVMSPSGRFMGEMVRSAKGGDFVVRSFQTGDPEERRWSSSFVVGNGVAVDDQGSMAYFEASNGKKPQLMIVASSTQEPIQTGVTVDGEPTCLNFSPNGKYVVVGTTAGGAFRYRRESGKFDPPESTAVAPGSADSSKTDSEAFHAEVTACAIADDGAAVFGFKSGQVRYFDGGLKIKTKELTERAVYRLPAEVRAVSITRIEGKNGVRRRISALGAWQPNNCLYPALPGQSLRVWELGDEKMEKIPVSNVCFPNQPILALGAWALGPDKAPAGDAPSATVLKAGSAGAGVITSGAGIHLLLPQGARWHPCPGCRLEDESDAKRKLRLLDLAKEKGVILKLSPKVLEERYGLKLW